MPKYTAVASDSPMIKNQVSVNSEVVIKGKTFDSEDDVLDALMQILVVSGKPHGILFDAAHVPIRTVVMKTTHSRNSKTGYVRASFSFQSKVLKASKSGAKAPKAPRASKAPKTPKAKAGSSTINTMDEFYKYIESDFYGIAARLGYLYPTKKKFVLAFHPDKCINTYASLENAFPGLKFNIDSCEGCQVVFNSFSKIYSSI